MVVTLYDQEKVNTEARLCVFVDSVCIYCVSLTLTGIEPIL